MVCVGWLVGWVGEWVGRGEVDIVGRCVSAWGTQKSR